MTQDTGKELRRLYDVEYGEPAEVTIRLAGVTLGAVLLHVYSGWVWLPALWAGLFLLGHLIQFGFLKTRLAAPGPQDSCIAGGLFIVVLASFAWLPTLLAMQEDQALAYSGSTLLAAVIAFLIKRADTMAWMINLQILSVWTICLCVLWAKMSIITSASAKLAAVLVTVAVLGYVSTTFLAARKTRIAAEEAASRNAQENKMAAIGQLAGGVAHDFNNALTVIIGNLELHSVLEDPKERHEVLSEAATAAIRAKDTVRQLLIYAHKAPSFRKAIEPTHAIAGMIQLSNRLVPEHIRVNTQFRAGTARIMSDESQLLTVMINLLTNAVDAMPTGGTLTIGCAMEALQRPLQLADGTEMAPGAYVCISFADSGKGIPPELLDRVTEPFFTTKPIGSGTGLGLSMAVSFARDSGGGLTIITGPRGTKVTIYLPPVAAHFQEVVADQVCAPAVLHTKRAETKTPPQIGTAQNA